MTTINEYGNEGPPESDMDPEEIEMEGEPQGLARLVNDPEGNFSFSIEDQDLFDALEQAPTPGAAPGVVKAGGGVSASFRGVTERGKKASGSVFDQEEAKADADRARLQAQMLQQKAGLDAGFNKQRVALDEMARVDTEHHEQLRDLHQQQLEFNQIQSNLEVMAHAKAKAEAAQYMQNYQQEMLGVKQMMMQSGNPMNQIGLAGGSILAGAAFVQGFLGARGININVTGQIDHWVEREMQAHQQAISNRQNMAQNQLTLYGLARQNAQDDFEARQRLRGFITEGMKAKLLMEADRYASGAAKADAMAKAAQLDLDQQNTLIALQNGVEQRAFQRDAQAIQAAAARAKASVDYGHLQVERDRERRLSTPKEDHKDPMQPISDPSSPQLDPFGKRVVDKKTGKVINSGAYLWAPDEKADKTNRVQAVKKAAELKSNYQYAAGAVDKLIELRKGAEKYMGLPEWMKERDEGYMRYKAEQTRLITIIRRAATGLSFTEGESKTYTSQLEDDKILGDKLDKLVYDFSEDMREHYNAEMNSLVGAGLRKLSPEERQAYGYQVYDDLDVSGQARDNINLSETAPVKSAVDQDVRGAVGNSGEFTDKTNPQKMIDGKPDFFDLPTLKEPTKGWQRYIGDGVPQPEETLRIEEIARGIISPESYRKLHPEDKDMPRRDEVLRGRLREALVDIGGKGTGTTARYANTLVGTINAIYDMEPAKARHAALMLMDTLGVSQEE